MRRPVARLCHVTEVASTVEAAALDVSWPEVVRAFCGHRADTSSRLNAYLDRHPVDVVALCLKGFGQLFLGRDDRRADAAAAESAARAAHRADDMRERRLLAALSSWRLDRPFEAAATFEAMLAENPRDLLAIKLHHGLLLMLGQPGRMRACLERVLPAWPADDAQAGFVLGCYAFSLEETGAFERAEAVGRRAVAMQPDDAWAIHAVAHVFESLGRPREGLAWLGTHAKGYDTCNVFRGHVHWHRALLHFQLEQFGRALDIYDEHVATPWAGDYRDMSNAVSLLWRLESAGVGVGRRWDRLAEIAGAHLGDRGSAFALAHYAVALGRGDGLDRLADQLAAPRASPSKSCLGSQAAIVSDVARPLCRGIHAWFSGDAGAAYDEWVAVEPSLARIGGSNAQRELFALMLIEAALATDHTDTARRLVAERQRFRPHDPWLAARAGSAT